MKKILIELFTAVMAACMLLGLIACGGKGVPEHDHVWDSGRVTKEATCFSEGTMTYACTVEGCDQTKTSPIGMIAHSWNDGEVTTDPTCTTTGTMTYTCTREGCGHTKEEPIAKIAHTYNAGEVVKIADFLTAGEKEFTCTVCGDKKREAIPAHTDFAEKFSVENSGWIYGYASAFDKQSGTLTFVRIETAEEGVYKAEGVELSKGQVKSSNNAVVAYKFLQDLTQKTKANVEISFKGTESDTVLNAYIIVGEEVIALNPNGESEWSYSSENAFEVNKNDIIHIVFENAGTGEPEGALSVSISAKCLHLYNGGEVIKGSKCNEEGEKEYTCIVCGEKYIEAIAMSDHDFDDGVITTKPTTTQVGEKTYTCKNGCGTTRTEILPTTVYSGANYTEDFKLSAQDCWEYGYTTDFNFGDNTFTFNALSAGEFAWLDSGSEIELKADWIKNERGGANAVITYVMPRTNTVNISVAFSGSEEVTRLTGRLHILKADGTVQLCDFISGIESSTWTYDKTVTVEEGSRISVIFFNEGSAGYYHGHFSMSIERVINYFDDFSTGGDNGWVYGYATDYVWEGENQNDFTFNALTAQNEYEWGGENGVIIKKDWILSEWKNAAIGYLVVEGQSKLNVKVTFTHAPDSENQDGESPTRFAVRLLVVGSDGKTKSMEYLYENAADWELARDVEVVYGDTVYAVLFKEADDWQQGRIQIVINEIKDEQTEPEQPEEPVNTEVANYFDDFSTGGDNGWVYGYATDYVWEGENQNDFTFNALTAQNEYEWGGENGVIIKKDWILSEWKNAAIGYLVVEGQSKLNVKVTFTHAPDSENQDGESPTRFAVRLLVVGSDGKTKSMEYLYENAADWELARDVEVVYGDTVYAVLFKEADDWQQGRIQIVINEK